MNTRVAAVAELERRIGHSFSDRDLLERALTHASVGGSDRKARHNQRLEFFGDRVLNLIIAEQGGRTIKRFDGSTITTLAGGLGGAAEQDG